MVVIGGREFSSVLRFYLPLCKVTNASLKFFRISKPSIYITTLSDEDLYGELPLDQDIIFYCESGIRAQAVVTYLIDKGYTKIMNWGSVTRWRGELE